MKIYISNNTDNTDSRIERKIRRIIKSAIKASAKHLSSGKSFEVSVVLVNNAEIHKLNLLHRNMDKPTDVLSFPMLEDDLGDSAMFPLGDIVISLEQAQIQAESYGHSLEREVGFLTVHSMLHLFGFDHETSEEDEAEMFARQDAILRKMKLVR